MELTTHNTESTIMASSSSTEDGIDKVLSLLASRACGQATNDEVEAAIEEVLGSRRSTPPSAGSRPPPSTAYTSPSTAAAVVPTTRIARAPPIEEDTEDYDEEETSHQESKNESKPSSSVISEPAKKRGRGRPRKLSPTAPSGASANNNLYDDIPLGRQGAKMMVAFGDGPQPLPIVVEKALLACRRCLHAAIRDARHVRRRHQRWYSDAQRHLPQSTRHKAKSMMLSKLPSDSQHFQFRALQPGSDALTKNALCGFAIDELATLFPEEMTAYQRWSELHDATTDQGTEEGSKETPNLEEGTTLDERGRDDGASAQPVTELPGGHLHERLEQFDIRTNRMDEDNYLQFSTVRYQGSFLPRRTRGEEERSRLSTGPNGAADPAPQRARGRPAEGSTAQMTSVMVRFLHWVGFDIDGTVATDDDDDGDGKESSNRALKLAAPNAETTHALAFLAHDFFGRIVEKAIFWRNVTSDETKVVLELGPGEQLQEADLQRALDDPEIRLEPLYAAKGTSDTAPPPKPQLYFGPGFEERLEMELDEMIESLTEDELKEREEEERFFAQLAAASSAEASRRSSESSGLPSESQEGTNSNEAARTTRKRKGR